jgi:hypothetical protein
MLDLELSLIEIMVNKLCRAVRLVHVVVAHIVQLPD